MTVSLPITPDQIQQLSDDTQVGTSNFVEGYNDILADIAADDPGTAGINFGNALLDPGNVVIFPVNTVLDPGTRFWYQQAPLINDAASQDPAKFFIRDVSEYGLRLKNDYQGNLQQVSDTIAGGVIKDTINSGAIQPLPDLLKSDITAAFDIGHMTIGGWGGSFYYWEETTTGASQSVGGQISAAVQPGNAGYDGGGDYDTFLAATGAALYDSVTVANVATLNTYVTSLHAEAPAGIKQQLVARALDIWNGGAIVGSPDDINGTIFNANAGSWSTPSTFLGLSLFPFVAPVVATDPGQVAGLNRERAYRSDNQAVIGHSNTDLNAASPASNPLPNEFGVPLGIPIDYTTTFNADGSYVGRSVQQSIDPSNSGPFLSADLYTADGVRYASELQQVGTAFAEVTTYDATGGTTGLEYFTGPPGGTAPVLNLAMVTSTGGDWTSAQLSFLADGTTLSFLNVTIADGSKISYLPRADGSWSEFLDGADGHLLQSIQHGLSYDFATRQVDLHTTVIDYATGGAITSYQNGDPAAPTPQIPGGVPLDLPSEQAMWASLLPANIQPTA